MSYILNALKKAEHDRLREEPQDLDDFVSSGWDPYQKTEQTLGAAARYWLPLTILVISAGLYYWFSTLSSVQHSEQVATEKRALPAAAETIDAMPIKERPVKERPVKEPQKPQALAAAEQALESPATEFSSAERSSSELSIKALPVKDTSAIELPAVNISGHIFIRSGSRLNRIFVGENTYHVGDSLDKNWVIESISSDSLTLRSGAMTTQLPLR